MKNFLQKFRKAAGFPFLFLLIMLLFFGVSMGTSGSTSSTGDSFELQYTTETNRSWVVFKISQPKKVDEDGRETTVNARLHDVYINYGTIYSQQETATLELQWGSSTTPSESFFTLSSMRKAVLFNDNYVAKEGDTPTAETDKYSNYIHDGQHRWIAPFGVDLLAKNSSYRSLNSPIYFKLVLSDVSSKYQNSNVLINEIVFVGELQDDKGGTGEYVPLPVEIDSRTYLPYEGKKEEGIERALALLDAQQVPTLSESGYYRYGKEEQKLVKTLAEMRMGSRYIPFDTYTGDRTYNSLGLNLAYLGTLMFGTSPFGLRFFNALASFGILIVGFFFVRRLFAGSDKAGLSFAVIYALCAASISLAHIGSPIMIGVFFLLASLASCYRFYALGMKKASPVATIPLLISGLCGALAVLVNGAFVIPVAGVVALFVAGVIKQYKKNRVALDEAIEVAEDEKAQGTYKLAKEEESVGSKKVKTAYTAYRYDTVASISVFACSLLLGIFVFSMLFALPVSYATNKIYNGITGAGPNLFEIAYKLFAAGFKGWDASGWCYYYPIFTGAGDRYAAALGIMNFAATLLGLVGIVFAIYRIVILAKNKVAFKEYMSVLVPCAGLVLSLVTATFAGGAVAFVLLANLFAFMLVSGGGELFAMEGEKQAKAVFIAKIISLVLLLACFGLLAVFTFSIPLPASFMAKFF